MFFFTCHSFRNNNREARCSFDRVYPSRQEKGLHRPPDGLPFVSTSSQQRVGGKGGGERVFFLSAECIKKKQTNKTAQKSETHLIFSSLHSTFRTLLCSFPLFPSPIPPPSRHTHKFYTIFFAPALPTYTNIFMTQSVLVAPPCRPGGGGGRRKRRSHTTQQGEGGGGKLSINTT